MTRRITRAYPVWSRRYSPDSFSPWLRPPDHDRVDDGRGTNRLAVNTSMSMNDENATAARSSEPRVDRSSSPSLLIEIIVGAVGDVRRLVLAGLIGMGIACGISLAIPNEYTAESSFIPDDAESMLPQGLGSLVGQFANLQAGGLSPRLAGDLISSRSLLTRTLYEWFPVKSAAGGADSVRLIDELTRPSLLGRLIGSQRDSASRELTAVDRLRSRVAADVNERTRLVTVVATFRDPELAAAVANRLVDHLDEFNTQTNQTRARATREFLEARTSDALAALRRAETALQDFYTANRDFERSPRLSFEAGRLRRQVDVQQQVYLTLVQRFETARVDEVKDTPVLTRVDRATPPPKKSSPRRTFYAFGGAGLGVLLVLLAISLRAFLQWYRDEDPEDYARLATAAEAVRVRGSLALNGRVGGSVASRR